MKYILSFLLLMLPYTAWAKLMDVAYFKLDNGLEVAVIENHKAPVVLQMLHYKTGSSSDPKGKGGLAHLLEHLMFRGTQNVPDKMFNQLTDMYGAENNAYTTYDETAYYEFSDVSKLELMMALEADRMRGLDISDEAFLKEREVVLQERFQRYETNPVSLFYELMNKTLWQEHPRANPVSGSVADIQNLSIQDVKNFYQRYYRPDNVLLVLSGDITPQEAEILADKYYGKIKFEKNEDLPTSVKSTSRAAEMMIKMKLQGVEQPRFVSYLRVEPEVFTKKDVLALDIFSEYLTGDDAAYLYDTLVYNEKKLLSVGVSFDYDVNSGGVMSFFAVPAFNKQTAEDILKLIFDNITLAVQKLNEQDIEKIKHQFLSNVIYLQENPEAAARFAKELLLNGYTAEEMMNFDEAIKNVTLKDVLAAWEKINASEVRLSGYVTGKEEK